MCLWFSCYLEHDVITQDSPGCMKVNCFHKSQNAFQHATKTIFTRGPNNNKQILGEEKTENQIIKTEGVSPGGRRTDCTALCWSGLQERWSGGAVKLSASLSTTPEEHERVTSKICMFLQFIMLGTIRFCLRCRALRKTTEVTEGPKP